MRPDCWGDGVTLYRSFRAIREAEPKRWREVLDCCRRSRRFRRWWLRTVRANPMYRLRCAWNGWTRDLEIQS